jgi:nitrogen fixation/metabolism regulation signal transduction histidine kinase
MNNLSLRTKTFVLLLSVVLMATLPLVAYYVTTARGLALLGSDPSIEATLSLAVEQGSTRSEKEEAALALTRYRQIDALKSGIVNQVLLVSIVYSGLVVVVALGIGYVFISRITKPLARLTEATRRIGDDANSPMLAVTTGGEIGQLERAFNAMSQNLARAREEKIQAERKATWQRVARVIAHEIKNPLTPIKLSTERMYEKFLMQSKDFPDVIKSTTSTILTEIANMQKLVEAFHTYAKFPEPSLRPADLNQVVTEACTLFSGESTPVTCTCVEGMPPMSLDAGQMREALTNLIRNGLEAVAESGEPGRVTVTTLADGSQVRVRVEDTGCGISPENMDRLFQPYFTTKAHGNGIGLALTERIVSMHGGTVTCESTVGKGTTFTIGFAAGREKAT